MKPLAKSTTTMKAAQEPASDCTYTYTTTRINRVRIRQPSPKAKTKRSKFLTMVKLLTPTTLPIMLQLLLALPINPVHAGLTIGGVSSTTSCHSALHSASGSDNHVSKDEYVSFVNDLTDDYFTYPQFDSTTNEWANLPVAEFHQLPMQLQMNFNRLACGGDFISCPDAHIVADGTGEGETATDSQTIYLYEVCLRTEEAVDEAKGALEEMEGVTASPVTPVAPTAAPSNGGGSTVAPAVAPSGGGDLPGDTTSPVSTPASSACPPIYIAGTEYEAADRVINPNDDSSGTEVYECKPSPYTPWCAQVGYEPGVALAWGEAWTLVGECVPTGEDVGTVNGGLSTVPAVEGTETNATDAVPTTSPISNSAGLGGNNTNDTTTPTEEVDLTDAITYQSTFHYQILISINIKAEDVADPTHQMNLDLVEGMNYWSVNACESWSDEEKSAKYRELMRRRLRGGMDGAGRRRLVVTTQESSKITNVTNVVCNDATFLNATNSNVTSIERIFSRLASTRQWTPQEDNSNNNDQHCLEITQGQTYYLLNEYYPDEVAMYLSNEFKRDVSDGSYLATYIPEPSRSAISMMYPTDGGGSNPSEDDKQSDTSAEAALKPDQVSAPVSTPFTGDSIVGDPDGESGGSNTAAIAAGVSIALVIAILGLFVGKRAMRKREDELLKDDDLKDLDRDDVEASRRNRNISSWSDDGSNSSSSYSGSRSSSSSSYSKSSKSSNSTSDNSTTDYYSNSGSASRTTDTSASEGAKGLTSVSASDSDSYASNPRRRAARKAVNTEEFVSKAAPVHDSMDSGSSVDEASLVEESAVEEVEDSDSDSDSSSDHGYAMDDEQHNESFMHGVDLTDAEGLEIPHEHFQALNSPTSKESSFADDSSAGSSGWESSVGDSSSTNTESVESFDPNLVDIGSSTISKSTPTSEGDDLEEYLVDRELLPGINPAVNPVVQPGVRMLPVDGMDEEDSAFMSDESDEFTKRTPDSAPPAQHEIESAIEQGDWAAVGATAALLATKRSSQVDDDNAIDSEIETFSAEDSAKMDALLDSGNWSGIVAVAARYADEASIQSGSHHSDEGSESSYHQYRAASPAHSVSSASVESAGESSTYTESQASTSRMSYVSNATRSVSGDASASSYSGTGSYTSYTGTYSSRTTNYTDEYTSEVSRHMDSKTPSSVTGSSQHESSFVNQSTLTSVSTRESENAEEKQRINAYRAEVEALVRRVVPDEIDNVDAIMVQFNGREEELIATLRGMQEKTIAQRARAAVQRSAKKEARTGGRVSEEYTASSEDPSSTYGSSTSTSGGPTSMASTAHGEHSITEEFADDSSHSGSESGSNYTSESAEETDEGSRSEYSHSEYSNSEYSHSEYSRSQYSESQRSGYSGVDKNSVDEQLDSGNWSGIADQRRSKREQVRSSHHSQDSISQTSGYSGEDMDSLDEQLDSGNWSGIADRRRSMREQGRSSDLD